MAEQWWTVPPAQHVSYLAGFDPQLLAIALDPLPVGAPAVVRFLPAVGGQFGDQIAVLLDELERAAIALFPRWLPGADRLHRSSGLGVSAVRALAARLAARSHHFGPFVVDLAERGLRGWSGSVVAGQRESRSRFPAEVRAAGLIRVIADAYGRESVTVLMELPDILPPADEQALLAAAEWLAQHGRATVWLAGAPPQVVDRVLTVMITLPADLAQLIDVVGSGTAPVPPAAGTTGQLASGGAWPPIRTGPTLTYPPLSGSPRTDSPAEQTLERALAPHDWARGRNWNQTYEWHILGRPYRLDLFWADEGLVVEVDGPDHRHPLKFADDRRRDVRLQLLGHDVLRFTNEQVLSDVDAATSTIKQLLTQRREAAYDREMGRHVHR